MKIKKEYIVIPLITFLTAFVGSLFTTTTGWYQTLKLPNIAPPGSVIGMVWTFIFICSAISAIIAWNKISGVRKNEVAGLFIVNALLNIFWSYIFFVQHLIGLAIFEAGILCLTVWFLIFMIWKYSKISAVLLFPYAFWTAFASYLTYLIWTLN
ncbi:tryptophan-rich sensory protein [Candidatus Nomurabacteria bacterium]|nr:tryptophan-rich sensory protein [Candidatus Nomurabacteria bacterium]